MDYKILWTDRSLNDLGEIVRFIAAENPSAAEKFGSTLVERVSPLARFPQLGSAFVKLGRRDIRELSARPYRIIYQIVEAEKTIRILTIWHGARREPEIS